MSTDVGDGGEEQPTTPSEISLSLDEETGLWVARDEDTGVASQGETREAALSNLDEAVAGVQGEGRAPTDEELRELGVDPEDNESGELPDFLQ